MEGLQPSVVAFFNGRGHWAYGGGDVVIDGAIITGGFPMGDGPNQVLKGQGFF